MKKLFASTCISVVFLFIICIQTAAFCEAMDYSNMIAYTNCKANLREKTSTKSDRITVLSKGTEVVIVETVENDNETWYYITSESSKVSGYILGSLLDIDEKQVSNSSQNESQISIVLDNEILYSNFLSACEQIGMDTSKIKSFKQVDDWTSGPRYSFTYMNMGFRVYCNMDSTVKTITLGVDTDIYKQGYEPYQVTDYIVNTSIVAELQVLAERQVANQLNYPSTANFSWLDWSIGREKDLYYLSSTVKAKNAFGVQDELPFQVAFRIDNDTAEFIYLSLDYVEIINNLSSIETPKRQKITTTSSNATSEGNSITLIDGQLGEYGKTITLDGKDYIDYHVPEGSYLITNNGKWCKVYLAKNKYYKNSDGYMESENVTTLEFSYYGETQTITVSSGQHIELTINASITLTPN